MLKIHTADGKTLRLDLLDGEQAKALLSMMGRSDFQRSITGVSVIQNAVSTVRCHACRCSLLTCDRCGQIHDSISTSTGVQYSLSRPDEVEPVLYQVEALEGERGRGTRVTMFAGESRVTMMVHRGQPSVRVGLSHPGKQRYNPNTTG